MRRVVLADPAGVAAAACPAPTVSAAGQTHRISPLSWPGRWLVSLYRSQIRPAIGARCSIRPNCSEYFLLASRKHGLLGFPMMADRLVREPGIVAEAEQAVETPDGVRYADPLSDHDGWLK